VENAGGNSSISEGYSIDYFQSRFEATDVILEKSVQYWIDYKMVDFICTINNERVGISIVRGMHYINPALFTIEDARRLIRKKLEGLIVARNCVCDHHSFDKSVLHVWCQTQRIADLIQEAFHELNEDNKDYLQIKGSIVILTTVCDLPIIYNNGQVKVPRRSITRTLKEQEQQEQQQPVECLPLEEPASHPNPSETLSHPIPVQG
jgi:hypothetical protein